MCLSGFCSDREERSFQPLQTCSCAKSQPRFGECGWPMHAHNQNKEGSDRKVHKEWERHKKELVWRPHDVCRSVAIDSLESCWPLCSMCLTIRRPCTGILCGPNLFHFVIIQLTVEYLVARKFQQWTCCRGGVLSWNHTGIQRAAESKPFFHKCL